MSDERLKLQEENRFLKIYMEEARKREAKLIAERDEALARLRELADDLK